MSRSRSYSELITIPSFSDRVEYLKLKGFVGSETFGAKRWLNQIFYKTDEWRRIRNDVILRDMGCDLAMSDHDLNNQRMYVHHIEPITERMIKEHDPLLIDLDNLVLVSYDTHSIIHYGDRDRLLFDMAFRTPNDTCPWKGGSNGR